MFIHIAHFVDRRTARSIEFWNVPILTGLAQGTKKKHKGTEGWVQARNASVETGGKEEQKETHYLRE
jgi:hypothetical protein